MASTQVTSVPTTQPDKEVQSNAEATDVTKDLLLRDSHGLVDRVRDTSDGENSHYHHRL
jgi:hypothetical protein